MRKNSLENLLAEIERSYGLACECRPIGRPFPRDVGTSHKTAIARKEPSRPTKMIAGEIQKKILDYGQGKGKDVEWLREHIQGYDPYWKNTPEVLTDDTYDVVLNNYVLNVIRAGERHSVLENIKRVLKPCGYAYISVRDDSEKIPGKPFEDGVITKSGTFQKTFSPDELAKLLASHFDEVEIISKRAPLLAKVKKKC
jgi:SAM-dependent methyltransferase